MSYILTEYDANVRYFFFYHQIFLLKVKIVKNSKDEIS